MRNDRGGVIVGYFTKIALVLSVFSLLCFDAVSVGTARIGVEDTAKGAARAAAEQYNETHNPATAYSAAVRYADEHDAKVDKKSFTVADDGTVSVTVSQEATTLLVFRIKKTAKWAHVTATASTKAA